MLGPAAALLAVTALGYVLLEAVLESKMEVEVGRLVAAAAAAAWIGPLWLAARRVATVPVVMAAAAAQRQPRRRLD
jgi:hypothetical protein